MSDGAIRRALISVSDKTGIVDFAKGLREFGIEILSTGGTAKALRDAGVELVEVDEYTGFGEMLDGRVKTLHPKVHGGILFRRDLPEHVETMKDRGFGAIDLVAVNLYPFESTVARDDVTYPEAIEQIDIGGPSMVRSAAKNHADVTIICDPSRYADVLAEMKQNSGATSLELRKKLARDAFRRTAAYDAAISSYFEEQVPDDPEEKLPGSLSISLGKARELRYGENPHQAAGLFGDFLDHFEQIHGKALSYNNLLDLEGAIEVAARLSKHGTATSIIKHSNPCGAAIGSSVAESYLRALETDPQSASGGIIAVTEAVDEAAAQAMSSHFIEILVAPEFSDAALEILKQKKNRVLLKSSPAAWLPKEGDLRLRSFGSSLLAQSADVIETAESDLRVVSKRAPSDEEMKALRFAWEIVRSVKSNAIVYTSADRTLGVGAGQMSRVDSAKIAKIKADQAGLSLEGSVVASDAFFPFPDGLLVCADAGATAAIQPGGSVRDEEVIAAADERGMAMVFTGRRHFRH